MIDVLLLMGSSKKKRKEVEMGQHSSDANLYFENLPFFKGVAQMLGKWHWGIRVENERAMDTGLPLGIEQVVAQNGLHLS